MMGYSFIFEGTKHKCPVCTREVKGILNFSPILETQGIYEYFCVTTGCTATGKEIKASIYKELLEQIKKFEE